MKKHGFHYLFPGPSAAKAGTGALAEARWTCLWAWLSFNSDLSGPPLTLLKEHWQVLKGVVKARLPKESKPKMPAACRSKKKAAETSPLYPAPCVSSQHEGCRSGRWADGVCSLFKASDLNVLLFFCLWFTRAWEEFHGLVNSSGR